MNFQPRIDLKLLRRRLAPVALAFLFWGAWAFLEDFTIRSSFSARWASFNRDTLELRPTLWLTLALTLLFTAPQLWGLFRRWGARRVIVFGDIFFSSLFVFFIESALSPEHTQPRLATAVLALTFLSLVLARAIFMLVARTSRNSAATPTLFDATLGPAGLAPLSDFSADQLERGPLLQALVALAEVKRESSLIFGLEGPWGSGKTTLLTALKRQLTTKGHSVVWFGAWNYREPDRLIRAYFEELERAIESRLALPGLKRKLFKLGAGLAEIGHNSIVSMAGNMLSRLSEVSVEELREELDSALKELDLPVVVLIDDLDRLDGDELKAVLRAVRLVSDLANLTHVVAFDREQISRTLFPDDPMGSRSRDYLAKLINIELSIGDPPTDLASRLMNQSLQPMFELIGETAAKEFVSHFNNHPLSDFMEALPTPREIRRVAAASAWKWEQMRRHINLFDSFILSIIQYRFPHIFRRMRAHPEWFVILEWWNDPWRLLYAKDWKAQRKKFTDNLRASKDRESAVALQMLELVAPENATIAEADARKQRRIFHPENYKRYFHLYIPASTITEAEMEDFAGLVLRTQAGDKREQMVRDRIEEEIRQGRIESFWTQWDLAFGPRVEVDASAAADIAAGIALASCALPDDSSYFSLFSSLDQGARELARLASTLTRDDDVTNLLEMAVRRATSLGFARQLIILTEAAAQGKGILGEKSPDLAVIRGAFALYIEDKFQKPNSLLCAPDAEIAAVIGSGPQDLSNRLVLRDLTLEPNALPKLLRTVVPKRLGEDEGVREVVEMFDPASLAERISLQHVQELTKDLDALSWSNSIDRELVERFRAWISTGQGKRVSLIPEEGEVSG
jgi:hypothetical protein